MNDNVPDAVIVKHSIKIHVPLLCFRTISHIPGMWELGKLGQTERGLRDHGCNRASLHSEATPKLTYSEVTSKLTYLLTYLLIYLLSYLLALLVYDYFFIAFLAIWLTL